MLPYFILRKRRLNGNIYYVRSLSTNACGIAEIVKTFRIKGMHVVEMNAVEEEFRINVFEIAGIMATVISFDRKSSAIARFMATVISFNRKSSAIASSAVAGFHGDCDFL